MANAQQFAQFIASIPTEGVGFILLTTNTEEGSDGLTHVSCNVKPEFAKNMMDSILAHWESLTFTPVVPPANDNIQDAELVDE